MRQGNQFDPECATECDVDPRDGDSLKQWGLRSLQERDALKAEVAKWRELYGADAPIDGLHNIEGINERMRQQVVRVEAENVQLRDVLVEILGHLHIIHAHAERIIRWNGNPDKGCEVSAQSIIERRELMHQRIVDALQAAPLTAEASEIEHLRSEVIEVAKEWYKVRGETPIYQPRYADIVGEMQETIHALQQAELKEKNI